VSKLNKSGEKSLQQLPTSFCHCIVDVPALCVCNFPNILLNLNMICATTIISGKNSG
jgi:hypothetical protein